jgi:micrococcal nuclease
MPAKEGVSKNQEEATKGESEVTDGIDEVVKGLDGLQLDCSQEAVEKLTAEATVQNTSVFVPKLRYGKVVKVYDGDTFHVVCPILNALDANDPSKFLTARFKVRLNNLDTPEIRTKCDVEKKYALMAKEVLLDRILNRVVELRNVDYDKYGRILADVFDGGISLANWICEQGLGVHYDGGHKNKIDWEELYTSCASKVAEE